MKKLIGFIILSLGAMLQAQTTAVSATVVDSDSTTWANGTWQMAFVPNPSNPNPAVYNIGGTPLSPSVMNQTGVLNGSGVLSVSVYQQAPITPVGSQWKLTVCPNAVTACGIYTFTAVGSSMDVSSALTSIIPAPRFKAVSGAFGYSDTEATVQLQAGSTYWNVALNNQRCYSGTGWQYCAPAGGGITQLTGDILAGPGSGSQVATLPTVNSNIGTCGDATHVGQGTFNAKGQVTACSAVAITFPPDTGITQLTGEVLAGPGSGSQAGSLSAVGAAGSCGDATHSCSLTFDTKGRETAQTNISITNGFTSGNNGFGFWVTDPTGTTTQRGQISITQVGATLATGTIAFPVTFATALDSLVITSGQAPSGGGADALTYYYTGASTSGASVTVRCSVNIGGSGCSNIGTTMPISWIAVGR